MFILVTPDVMEERVIITDSRGVTKKWLKRSQMLEAMQLMELLVHRIYNFFAEYHGYQPGFRYKRSTNSTAAVYLCQIDSYFSLFSGKAPDQSLIRIKSFPFR
ncbi:hypothetical protein ANCDUO_18040 [Ancylostoma duodenale]|uniref:Uncharacterized protein n=1 Tax=Ancylostoma duodenale TaxID=51022 RepID=A0A0C2FTH2_9BILA|nr:hypothetical protein ANCDUO_18040 [Ancylostoma duodenale]